MTIRVHSAGLCGLEGIGITVEVDIGRGGLPGVKIIGLPHKSIAEARERVRTAMRNAGFGFPQSRIIINLAPAYMQKKGTHLDLPIAVGILAGQKKTHANNKTLYVGEISLDGTIRAVQGLIPILNYAEKHGFESAVITALQQAEVQHSKLKLYTITHILELVTGLPLITYQNPQSFDSLKPVALSSIEGQVLGKRAIEISVSGWHSMLLRGHPGVGKSLLAQAAIGITPPPSQKEQQAIGIIASATGYVCDFVKSRPLCQPHHSISVQQLIGGGTHVHVGLITQAHRGVLILDELPEFSRSCLEALRQPMEKKSLTMASHCGHVKYPCNPLLIATANPCPCGYLGHPTRRCVCSQGTTHAYQRKISGPLLDRFDIHVSIEPEEKSRSQGSTISTRKITTAWDIQRSRKCHNAHIPIEKLHEHCPLDAHAQNILDRALQKLEISKRAVHKALRVARTIADLEQSHHISEKHIAEALSYRM